MEKKTIGNKYELKVTLEDKMNTKMYYNHQLGNVAMDETLAKIKAQKL